MNIHLLNTLIKEKNSLEIYEKGFKYFYRVVDYAIIGLRITEATQKAAEWSRSVPKTKGTVPNLIRFYSQLYQNVL